MKAPAFHSLFERLVPELRIRRQGDAHLYALRIDGGELSGRRREFVDLTVLIEDDVYAIPFIAIDGERIAFPKATAALQDLIRAFEPVILRWRETKGENPAPQIDLIGSDEQLAAALAMECVVPGLSMQWELIMEGDRYGIAATRAAGRRILDLNPGIGYGTRLLARSARSVKAVSRDPAEIALARRFRLFPIRTKISHGDFDFIIAMNIAAQRVGTILAQARTLAPDALLLVTSRGAEGEAALKRGGLRVAKFVHPALGRSVHDEFVGWGNDEAAIAPHGAAVESRPITASAVPLRVLFALRPSAKTVFGGDAVQVQRTAQELRKRGHDVVVSMDARPDPTGFDLAHVTNLGVPAETLEQVEACAAVPLALMPIYADHADEAAWGMLTASIGLGRAFDDAERDEFLSALAERRPVPWSSRRPPPTRSDFLAGDSERQKRIVSTVDFVIANAYSEVHRIFRHLDCSKPFAIVPSGIDPALYFPGRAAEFSQKYGLHDFVLTTGRFEARKNQAILAVLMRRHPERQYVMIGGNYETPYGEVFRANWPLNCLVLPQVSEAELAGAYAASRVSALPSWNEVVSLSSLNAAACEATLVVTRNSYEHEYLGNDAFYCDPADARSIGDAVDRAWGSHAARAERRAALAERVRRDYTWSKSAELTERAYYRMLADRSLRE